MLDLGGGVLQRKNMDLRVVSPSTTEYTLRIYLELSVLLQQQLAGN